MSSLDPILVVGGGPVGLTTALMLSRHGVAVRIIESLPEPSPYSKALAFWRRTLLTLDPVLPIEHVAEGHREIRGVRICADFKPLGEVSFAQDDRGIVPGLFVPQYDTERLLLEALSARDVQLERSTTLRSFEADDDGVWASLQGPGGEERIRTPWLVGCDGGHSSIRHVLGLSFPGDTKNRRWLLGDIRINEDEGLHQIIVETSAKGTVAMFPMGPNHWRLMADGGPVQDGEPPTTVDLETMQDIVNTRTSRHWTITSADWLTEFRINERQVDNYVHGRVLLAGDAAHVHSPAGGQGMNTGMQDAANLAWKIAVWAKGGADDSLLQTYQAERHPIGHSVVKNSSMMMRAATPTNSFVRGLRSLVIPMALGIDPLRQKIVASLTEDTVTYRHGPLAGARRSHVTHGPGDGFPDQLIDFGGTNRPATDLLRNPHATLVVFGPDQSLPPITMGAGGAGLEVTVRRVGDGGDATDAGGRLAAALGLDASGLVLVRPDGIIAVTSEDIGEVQAWCESLGQVASTV
ncbi:MAG: FAD-dependent oxidoreductase [Phycisphaerales bacterium]|nr:FAD-dependent oxidoreductase [Phycisphaerales bacterium]